MDTLVETVHRRERRRISHSVIEKRRREKINLCLKELQNLVPSCKDENLQKLAILERTVEYLHILQRQGYVPCSDYSGDDHSVQSDHTDQSEESPSIMRIDNLLC
jgi:hypothetical protein